MFLLTDTHIFPCLVKMENDLILFVIGLGFGSMLTCLCAWLWSLFGVGTKIKRLLIKTGRRMPNIQNKMEREKNDIIASVRKKRGNIKPSEAWYHLPSEGLSLKDIKNVLHDRNDDKKSSIRMDSVSGGIYYDHGDKLDELYMEMMRIPNLFQANALHLDIFGNFVQMEAEIVQMTKNMYIDDGDDDSDVCGVVTFGGTMSILHALYCCKKYMENSHTIPIGSGEIILPQTAHAAFHKGADMFNFKIVEIGVNDHFELSPMDVENAINSNTIMIVGSAPSYPHGIIDPIHKIGIIAQKYNILFHVDACLGGFLIPFLLEDRITFDSVPGMTSLSCDTHKYGQSPKGSSVLLYKNPKLKSFQNMHHIDWSGGIYATTTFSGSKSCIPIALTWGAMLYHGDDGYRSSAHSISNLAATLEMETLYHIPDLIVCGRPVLSVRAFQSINDQFDVYDFVYEMMLLGWELNPLQYPPAFHFCITVKHVKDVTFIDRWVTDIKFAYQSCLDDNVGKSSLCGLYGTTQMVPKQFSQEISNSYLNQLTNQ